MDKIAVIKTGGKQYVAEVGEKIKIEKIDQELGAQVKFDTLLVADQAGKQLQVGQPSLGELGTGKEVKNYLDKKINVLKFKNKTRYTRNRGHRQPITEVEITAIA